MGNQYYGAPRYDAVYPRGSIVTGQGAGVITGTWAVSVPTQTQVGDYMLIIMTTNADTVTKHASWTQLQQVDGVAVATHTTSVYGKVADANDVGGFTYNWTVSGTTSAPDVAVCWSFANVDSTKVVSAVGTEMTSAGAKTTPAVSTTVPSLMLHGATARAASPSVAPTTFTYASGTKTEGTNSSAVFYTASGAPAAVMTTTVGSQAGITVTTATSAPTTGYPLQIGLGAKKVANAISPPNLTQSLRAAL